MREEIKQMINSTINDKKEEAEINFHNYLKGKIKQMTGQAASKDDDSKSKE